MTLVIMIMAITPVTITITIMMRGGPLLPWTSDILNVIPEYSKDGGWCGRRGDREGEEEVIVGRVGRL